MLRFMRLLHPGMHIKRWILLFLVGMVAIALGLAYLLVQVYRTQPLPEIASTLTLQFIDRPTRAILFLALGVAVCGLALLKLNQSVLETFVPSGRSNIVDVVYNYRFRQKGPKIVAVGGGTGLSTLLRGLKEYTSNITAIVTVADDGGSSGRLRRELGVLPPGDFRNCIVALADAEPLMGKLFQYRFARGSGLDGHSFGNLFIVAMSGVTGNFEEAIRESSRVLAVRGQILPSTLEDLTLCAELADQDRVEGESSISRSTKAIKRVYLQPSHPAAYPEAVKAILEADMVVVGPGSLYTSVLPNLLVEGISTAMLATRAMKVYVCNVATQRGETDNFSVRDHAQALLHHLSRNPLHFVLANSQTDPSMPEHWGVTPVKGDADDLSDLGVRLVRCDVVDEQYPLRHDPKKLTQALARLYNEGVEPASREAASSGH